MAPTACVQRRFGRFLHFFCTYYSRVRFRQASQSAFGVHPSNFLCASVQREKKLEKLQKLLLAVCVRQRKAGRISLHSNLRLPLVKLANRLFLGFFSAFSRSSKSVDKSGIRPPLSPSVPNRIKGNSLNDAPKCSRFGLARIENDLQI